MTVPHVDVEQQVIAAAGERASALARGDAASLDRLLHPDFRWTTHRGDVYDRDVYVRRNTTGVTVWRSQTLDRVDVAVVGEAAVLTAEATDVVVADDGGTDTFMMPMTQVWVREDGAWRCLAGHAGPRRG